MSAYSDLSGLALTTLWILNITNKPPLGVRGLHKNMKKNIIQGQFTPQDAIDILTQIIHVKVKFHEGKINNAQNEEDTKMREKRIKELQKDLFEIRENIASQKGLIDLKMELDLV